MIIDNVCTARHSRKYYLLNHNDRMHVDSTPWGSLFIVIGIFALVMACRYYTRFEASGTSEFVTELQQVLVVHPDGEEAIAKRLST